MLHQGALRLPTKRTIFSQIWLCTIKLRPIPQVTLVIHMHTTVPLDHPLHHLAPSRRTEMVSCRPTVVWYTPGLSFLLKKNVSVKTLLFIINWQRTKIVLVYTKLRLHLLWTMSSIWTGTVIRSPSLKPIWIQNGPVPVPFYCFCLHGRQLRRQKQ